MLTRLAISNLVLIRQADLNLRNGLTTLTGETGAGKTIFAQSVSLLLGGPADAKLVGPHATDTYVEGEFDLPDGLWAEEPFLSLAELRPDDETSLTLARKLSGEGRSRALAWGRTISREQLAAAGERLLSVSGQFEQRRLARPAYQLDLLDGYLGAAQTALRGETAAAWSELVAARRAHAEITRDRETAELRLEGMRMLVEAVDGFKPGEEDELHAELRLLAASHDLLAATDQAVLLLSPEDGAGAAEFAAQAAAALRPYRELAPELAETTQGLGEAEILLRELAANLCAFHESIAADPARQAEIEQRLSLIGDAKRRFREGDYDRLLARAAEAAAELAALGGDDPLSAANERLATAEAAYVALTAKLHAARAKAAPKFAAAVATQLHELAMGDGEFRVELAAHQPGPTGTDEARFLIRPNKGLPFNAAAEVASGGELSRLALALRIVARATSDAPTVLFDEIDAGIGGVTAHAVAAALKRLSADAQVLVITHLPQIATLADTHLRIEKTAADTTLTEISPLDPAERKQELKRMAGGVDFLAEIAS